MTTYTVKFNDCPLSQDMLIDLVANSLHLATSSGTPYGSASRYSDAKQMCSVWIANSKTRTFPNGRFHKGDVIAQRSGRLKRVVSSVNKRNGSVSCELGTFHPYLIRPVGKMFVHNFPDQPPEDIIFDGFPLSKLEIMIAISFAIYNNVLNEMAMAKEYSWEGETIPVWSTIKQWVAKELGKLVPIGSVWVNDSYRRSRPTASFVVIEGPIQDNLTFQGSGGLFVLLLPSYTMVWANDTQGGKHEHSK